MTKTEAKALQKKYNMIILRHPITNEASALYLESDDDIPELDALAGKPLGMCYMEATYTDAEARYKLFCPTTWFDLWGWRGEE